MFKELTVKVPQSDLHLQHQRDSLCASESSLLQKLIRSLCEINHSTFTPVSPVQEKRDHADISW